MASAQKNPISPPGGQPRRSRYRVALELSFLVVLVVLVGDRVPGPKDFLLKVELSSQDLRYFLRERLRQSPDTSELCIVAIDEKSVQARTWPWSRSVYAGFVRRMREAGARCVLFDILFTEPRDAPGDQAFAATMHEAGNVFLLFHAVERGESAPPRDEYLSFASATDIAPTWKTYLRFMTPLPSLAEAAAGGGHCQIGADPDDKYRRAFLFAVSEQSGKAYPHAALDVARYVLGLKRAQVRFLEKAGAIQLGSRRLIPVDVGCRVQLNYPGGADSFKSYSFVDVEQGRVSAEAFRGRIVLVGATAAGLYDNKPQPLTKKFPGVATNATLIWNLLHGNFVGDTTPLASALLVALMGVLIGLVVPRLSPLGGGLFALVLAAAYLLLAQYEFGAHTFMLEVVPQLLTVVVGFVTVTAYRLATEEREKKKIRDTFSLYVAPSVVNELLDDPARLQLDGVSKEITLLFSDIRGFTTMSEQLPPREVVSLLNEYFSVMTDIIFDHEGTIDKFIGDAIMVLFNVPKEQPNHAELAVRTALAMRQGLRQLQEKWATEGKSGFGIGIGINTGEAVVGNIGSPTRMDFTAIGDNVNLASRLEGLTRNYNAEIIISEHTCARVKDLFQTRKLDRVRVKGRDEPVTIYAVEGIRGDTPHSEEGPRLA